MSNNNRIFIRDAFEKIIDEIGSLNLAQLSCIQHPEVLQFFLHDDGSFSVFHISPASYENKLSFRCLTWWIGLADVIFEKHVHILIEKFVNELYSVTLTEDKCNDEVARGIAKTVPWKIYPKWKISSSELNNFFFLKIKYFCMKPLNRPFVHVRKVNSVSSQK